MGALPMTWAVISCWTFEASLSGYDDNDQMSVHPTPDAARAERDRLARELIGTLDPDERRWCIGVGIASELRPGTFDYPQELEWADHVPGEFLALVKEQETER